MTAGLIAVLVAASTVTPTGASAVSAAHRFLEFYSGVFSLVALSVTAMIGLAATDRVILLIHHRIHLQNVHRATATTAMVFLAVHVAMKVMEGHARPLDVLVPFMASHRTVYVGLGTVATYLMVLATWTGAARGRFAGSMHPGLWRLLHAAAYACWLIALVHGLTAGRSAKTWVLLSYGACLVAVGLALIVRLAAAWGRRSRVAKARTTGTIRPVGVPIDAGPMLATSIALTDVDNRANSPGLTDSPGFTAEYIEEMPVMVAARHSADADPWSDIADRGPVLKPRRPGEEISDDDFWAHMRGEVLR